MADGVIVRTHPMRGTWHYMAAAGCALAAALKKPRNHCQQCGLVSSAGTGRGDDCQKPGGLCCQALQGGKQRTRGELAAAHGAGRHFPAGLRLTFLLARAEAEGVICSGPRRGKQFTYALLDEVAPALSIAGA